MITTTLEHASLSEVVALLTQKLQEGYLLHGRVSLKTTLTPRASYDGFRNETYTAVFATDQPLIASYGRLQGNA